MYFNNRHNALCNQTLLAKAVVNSRTFDEHQATTAMFLTVLVSNVETPESRGWLQNELQGITAPMTRVTASELEGIINAVTLTLKGCGPQTSSGNAFLLVDDKLREDERFSECPVGTVAMFRGVVDVKRWGLNAQTAQKIALPGWFVSPEEFVVHDPVLAGSYMQGLETRWHGGEYVVGHLRRPKNESLKLMNRPLSETYALARIYHDTPSNAKDLWLYPGMRFDLFPEGAALSRILTAPEDTQPHRVLVARHGATDYIRHLLAPTLAELSTAWSVTSLPHVVENDSHFKNGGVKGAADLLHHMLSLNPALRMDTIELNKALALLGCGVSNTSDFIGRDGQRFDWSEYTRQHSYTLGRADSISSSSHNHKFYIQRQQAYMLSILACMVKYEIPRELFTSICLALLPRSDVGARHAMLCKLKKLCGMDIDVMDTIVHLSGDYNQPLHALCGDVFAESRIARSRATYHADLTTSKRKKVLAKFYPVV